MLEILRFLPCASISYAVALVLLGGPALWATDPFQEDVLPFLNTYCIKCHSAKTASGELDLTRFTSTAKVVEDFRQWDLVIAFLKKEEMPPAKAKQPLGAERAKVVAALEQLLRTEARKLAGDPGVVPPRRLTNAEYDYTIHDLTGADIRAAKSFPVDPAAGEGFNNTGEALTMSPTLFKKYYAAAEFVADHALLTPSALTFARHPVVTFADRQKHCEQAILQFYDRHAVDYEKCLTTLWLYRHRPPARQKVSIEEWATEAAQSPKYLASLWNALQEDGSTDKFAIHWLRQRWKALPPPRNPTEPVAAEIQAAVRTLAADIQRTSAHLCPPETPAIVANAGNAPIEHLTRRQRTAESRDTLDKTLLGNRRFSHEFRVIAEPSLKLVVQVADARDATADGYVILHGGFATTHQTTDGRKRWSLRAVLAEHAPDQLAKWKFGVHPRGDRVDADDLVLKAPSVLEMNIPTKAFALEGKGNVTFTADCRLDHSTLGIALVRVLDRAPARGDVPNFTNVLLDPKHPAAGEFEASAAAFCRLFPNRFYYVDATRGLSAGFHLIEGFFRDDQPLCRSVLTDPERQQLDRLWDELYFVTGIWEKFLRGFVFFERSERNFLKHTDFDSFKEEDPELVKDEVLVRFKEVYLRRSGVKATGDELAKHPITVFFEDVRAGLRRQSEKMERAQTIYLKDLKAFAARAYRRPLTDPEIQNLEKFYGEVCHDPGHGIDAAVRASLVRVLVSPHFCFRLNTVPAGESVAPLSELALAARLSYFSWSSTPDEELLAIANAGKLRDERVLREQVRRMLKDPKVSRFALEFFGQWLGYRDFLTQETVNRQVFPVFDDALKQAMFEEPTRVATDLIQRDRPITELLSSDATLVNKRLAQHYGLSFRGQSEEWERMEGLHACGRGGLLGMAVFLTKNSQPQRTSPVKRGFWVVHKLLGEHIPPPPADVVALPAKESETPKTIRQLMTLHVDDMRCARCHVRFDAIGLSMEGFDPIGRSRVKDLAGRPVDNVVQLPSGKNVSGVPEFGQYLASHRSADFSRTLCRKFLGYALGRSLQLSDQPLLEKMQVELEGHEYHLSALFELVATSPQFRNQRCQDFTPSRFHPEPQGGE